MNHHEAFLRVERLHKRKMYRRFHHQETCRQAGDIIQMFIGLGIASVGIWSMTTAGNNFTTIFSLFILIIGVWVFGDSIGYYKSRKDMRTHLKNRRKGLHS